MMFRFGTAITYEMVLADMSSTVTSSLQAGGERLCDLFLAHSTASTVVKRSKSRLVAPACESHARGAANGACRVGLGQDRAFTCESVEMGGLDVRSHPLKTKIHESLVVSDDQ